MDINLSISAATTITQKIAVRIYKSTAPTVVAAVQQFNPPHSSPRNIAFLNVDAEVYIVNIYETVGDPVTGTLRHSFIYDPSFQQAEVKSPEYLVFAAGNTGYSDPTWAGWEIELVIRNAAGPLSAPTQIVWVLDGSSQVIGFELAQAGDTFAGGEQVVVTFVPKITTFSPIVVSTKFVTDSTIITSNTTLTASSAGKLMILQGATTNFTVKLPAISSTATYLMYVLASEGGTHISVNIEVDGGGNISYFGSRTSLILAQGERAMLIYTGTNYIVLNEINGVLRVGDIIDQFDKDSSVQGCIFADGTLLDRVVYKRLWNYVSQLDISMLVSEATWATGTSNHGKFSTGDGATTFRIPRLYSDGFLRGVDGTVRLAGSHQDDAVLDHQHITPSIGGDNPGDGIIAYGKATSVVAALSAWFRAVSTAQRDLTSLPVTTVGAAMGNATENLVNNIGVYKLIRY
jgi:hypothetical protein